MKNKNFRIQFNLYFIVYGITIAIICISTSYYFQLKEIKNSLDKSANEIFKIKTNSILKPYIKEVNNTLLEIKNNPQIDDFINNKNDLSKKESAVQILFAIASTNLTIKQLRIIDKTGYEIIRIEKNAQNNKTTISNNLQDKTHRYYFNKLSSMKEEKIWYSKFDLNIENGKVETPFSPTFRVGIPIIKNNNFEGAIVLNLFSEELFKKIATSSGFDPYIIDKDFNFILHPNDIFSYNKYKDIKRDFNLDFPKGLNTDGVYSYPLKNIIDNEDEAIMILKVRKDFETILINDKSDVAVITLLVVILISFIISFIVSKGTTKLQNDLIDANEKLETSKILDKYVISSTTTIDGTILDISEAFRNSSGYTKNELIGQKMSIIKHPDRDIKIIKNLWDTILKGKIWIGEIENKNKNGESYWLKQHIIPKFDIDNNIDKFISLGIDVTAKKKLEVLASIDNLTQIYNRRMIDEFLQTEIDIAKRYNKNLSLIIFDIDYFKSVNDTFGHLIGDKVLIETAKVISENLRKADIFGRYGGEEFIIICTETNLNSAFLLAEKLRLTIEKHLFDEVGQKTISLGVSRMDKNDTLDSIIKKADTALYDSKNKGRNKTTVYGKLD